MNIQLYHPSKSGKGFAASFSDSFQNDCIFATIIRQSGWDENTKTGTFKASREDPTASTIIKLNDLEVSAILDSIDRSRPFSTFHDGDAPKTINFIPWIPKVADGEKPLQKGYSFTITITSKEDSSFKNSFYIGFSFAEGRLIREFLINCLNNHFNLNREKSRIEKSPTKVSPNKYSPQIEKLVEIDKKLKKSGEDMAKAITGITNTLNNFNESDDLI